ncbi:MAG: hypothetical protein NVS1B11_32970 [Terriglobales bacterium]
MAGENHNTMQCNEFDALLSDAVEERLSGEQLAEFEGHARACATCGPLVAEATSGRHWLKSLAEVEPPALMVENILVATTGLDTARLRDGVGSRMEASWIERMRERASLVVSPILAVARQPRFAMSFGMVFFSLSITLSLAGVKLSDMRRVDLRPASVKRSYYETSGRVIKYYENIRFVYEIESRMREFKRATTPAEAPPESNDKTRKNNTSGQPENAPNQIPRQREERNYSQGENQPMLASTPNVPPVVLFETAYRRNS